MHVHPVHPPPGHVHPPPPQPERLVMRKDEAVSLYIKKQKGFGEHTIQSDSKLYGAAGKLTTHGSQHFHIQNALKAVAFLSTAESPQLRVDTHIRTQK
jgi:hypothetical protein